MHIVQIINFARFYDNFDYLLWVYGYGMHWVDDDQWVSGVCVYEIGAVSLP